MDDVELLEILDLDGDQLPENRAEELSAEQVVMLRMVIMVSDVPQEAANAVYFAALSGHIEAIEALRAGFRHGAALVRLTSCGVVDEWLGKSRDNDPDHLEHFEELRSMVQELLDQDPDEDVRQFASELLDHIF